MGTGTAAPREGALLSPFALPDDSGRMIDIEQYRQSRNLVVCMCRKVTEEARGILLELARASSGIAAEDGVPVVVIAGKPEEARRLRQELDLPFSVLADGQGVVMEKWCPQDLALYVTDRFREIFLARHGAEAQVDGQAIIERLAFIERQCPE